MKQVDSILQTKESPRAQDMNDLAQILHEAYNNGIENCNGQLLKYVNLAMGGPKRL